MDFQPFFINLDKIKIFVSSVGKEWNIKWDGVGEGFISSFTSKFREKSCLFVQKVTGDRDGSVRFGSVRFGSALLNRSSV